MQHAVKVAMSNVAMCHRGNSQWEGYCINASLFIDALFESASIRLPHTCNFREVLWAAFGGLLSRALSQRRSGLRVDEVVHKQDRSV